MRCSLTKPFLLAWAPLALMCLWGCANSPRRDAAPMDDLDQPPTEAASVGAPGEDPAFYTDDFGGAVEAPPITEESVSEEMMLHQRAQLELNAGMVMPIGEFEVGPSLGLKGSLEAYKNIFFGLSFDWARQNVDEGISSLDDPGDLERADADQFYEYINRYNLLMTADYDIPLEEDFLVEDTRLILRLGLGAGSSIIVGKEDKAIDETVKINTYFGFLLRPAVSLRWMLSKRSLVFFTAAYDFVYPDKIDVRITGSSRRVDDDLYFGTFLLQFGVAFEF